jgi:hypothetical protein
MLQSLPDLQEGSRRPLEDDLPDLRTKIVGIVPDKKDKYGLARDVRPQFNMSLYMVFVDRNRYTRQP